MDLAALTLYFTKYGAIAIFIIVFLEYLNLVPAVKLSDLLAHLLGSVLGGQLSHGLEVNLLSGGRHIQKEFLGKGSVLYIA